MADKISTRREDIGASLYVAVLEGSLSKAALDIIAKAGRSNDGPLTP